MWRFTGAKQALFKLHKLVALVVSVQVALWMVSGLSFSLLSHKEISGRYLLAHQTAEPIRGEVDFKPWLHWYPDVLQLSVNADSARQRWQVETRMGSLSRDKRNSEYGINEVAAREIAQRHLKSKSDVMSVNLITEPSYVTRKVGVPVWQVEFNDSAKSSVFVNAKTGKIRGLQTSTYRIFDWLWMLHIMDYDQRKNLITHY